MDTVIGPLMIHQKGEFSFMSQHLKIQSIDQSKSICIICMNSVLT